ncbi:uncharacterized protein LOC134260282 [Saccostrea cucullata]|uniref:uncharacterized protein LOC134260282 n=1 Tax=Saccostrea cuccullata TaxID=36930 RepID=UPI002ED587FD
MWIFLPIYKRLVYAFLLSVVVPVRAPHFYTTQQCIPRSHFRQGRMIWGAMRKLGNTGPLTCIRECLLRRSCVSISYNTEGSCLLQYARASLSNPLYGSDNAWQYTEKPDMYAMVNTYPCNDAVCGENERCEVLNDKSVFCSITECTKPPEGIFRSWRTYASTTRAVGDVREYSCRHGTFLNVATYTCKQDGSWGITDILPQNINECNKRECQKNEDFLYIKETNGCYRFFNESKNHSQAEEYCRSSFRHGHLFLADSSEKIDALKYMMSYHKTAFSIRSIKYAENMSSIQDQKSIKQYQSGAEKTQTSEVGSGAME